MAIIEAHWISWLLEISWSVVRTATVSTIFQSHKSLSPVSLYVMVFKSCSLYLPDLTLSPWQNDLIRGLWSQSSFDHVYICAKLIHSHCPGRHVQHRLNDSDQSTAVRLLNSFATLLSFTKRFCASFLLVPLFFDFEDVRNRPRAKILYCRFTHYKYFLHASTFLTYWLSTKFLRSPAVCPRALKLRKT